MNSCLVCNQSTATQVATQKTTILLLGIMESRHGWVAHSDCMFQLIY